MSVSTYIIQFEESYFISVIDGLRDSRSRLAQTYITLRELVRALSPSRGLRQYFTSLLELQTIHRFHRAFSWMER